jgi:hypothetical protein
VIYDSLLNSLAALASEWTAFGASLTTLLTNAALTAGEVAATTSLQTSANAAFAAADAAHTTITSGLGTPNFLQPAINTTQSAFQQSWGTLQVQGSAWEATFASATGADVDAVEAGLASLRDFVTRSLGELEQLVPPLGPAVSASLISDSVEDIASYPMLTEPLGPSGGAPAAYAGGQPAGALLQRTVDAALKATLGRLPKFTDDKAFVAALSQSFSITQVEGRSVVRWQPRSYVGQTELGGAVTGAQASVYARAADALAAVEKLVAGLYPLLPDADPQEMDAARAIVLAEFRAAVAELGMEGGPRTQRVDELFKVLLHENVTGIGGITAVGMIDYLGKVFGLDAGQVNTIDEEQDVSNFLLVTDWVVSTEASWNAFKTTVLGKDLGTRLILLSKALQVVAESVDEVYAAMDSVFVGEAERSVASFRVGAGPDDVMLVSDLLSWVGTFATDEAPSLAQEGGRRGVVAIISTADTLATLLGQLVGALPVDPTLPEGLRHPRVRHPLNELRTYLGRVAQLAEEIRNP